MKKIIANPDKIFPNWMQLNPNKEQHKCYRLYNNSICCTMRKAYLPYYNHIETSSFYNSCILFYGANEEQDLKLVKHLVFPTFRKKINDTRGSFAIQVEDEVKLYYEDYLEEKLDKVSLNGKIIICSKLNNIKIKRTMFSSTDSASFITIYSIRNNSNEPLKINLEYDTLLYQASENECYENKTYQVKQHVVFDKNYDSSSKQVYETINIEPKQSVRFYSVISCLYDNDVIKLDLEKQEYKRNRFLSTMKDNLRIKTNNNILNTLAYFCKVRTCESIFLTRNGYFHSPGGGQYYASLWTNDELEYTFPLFAYLDYKYGNKAAINAFDLYEKYMYQDKALVTSIIAEGIDYWNGAKDRGDGCMYSYGLSSYLLTKGDKELAKKYIKPLTWCLEYTLKQMTKDGVIASDSDELENRFESGNINLTTNSLAYISFVNSANLLNELGIDNNYSSIAKSLKNNIDKYFYSEVEGYKTYKYCNEEKYLRSHQCYPLICDILDRKDEVTKALVESKLNTKNGFLTATYSDVFWDRITLMVIRALFIANHNKASETLINYSKNRLLKEHVPYPVEAYPEGNQAHLAAESALYVRIFIEGILGYQPNGFNSFYLRPTLSPEISKITVRNVYFCNRKLQIKAMLKDDKVIIYLKDKKYTKYIINNNERILITL